MGQDFFLINIDKRQRVFLGKVYKIFGTEIATYLCDPDAQSSWAGDRLILLGDYVQNFPAGIEDETDYEDLFDIFLDGPDGSDDGSLPPCRKKCHYDDTSVLRNLCTREYIRADLFLDRDCSHPGFGDVIMPKIIWCVETWRGEWTGLDPRGPWAGGRFDIVHVDVVKGHSEWKDITETEFFNCYKTLANMDMMDSTCTCGLYQKYSNEHENFHNIIKKKKSWQQETVREAVRERASNHLRSATGPFYPSGANSLSSIEILPAELREEIMAYLSTGDLAACAAASKILSFQATPYLYSSVTIKRADQTKTLLETISRCPELTRCIKDLRVVTLAHWESLQIAHEILKRLPRLEYLNIARCWLSYGNLPYWEYPFTLSTLTWGLKKDSAFDEFCLSQPGVQTVLLDPIIGGFLKLPWFPSYSHNV